MGHRSALCAAGGEPASRTPGMGGADLQRRGGAAQPGEPLLDAAAAGNPEAESPRLGRLHRAANDAAHPHRVFPVLAVRALYGLHSAGAVTENTGRVAN